MANPSSPAAAGHPTASDDPAEQRGYYSVSEVAALLGVSRVSVWRWISTGRLPVARLGHRTVRIKQEDIAQMARSGVNGSQLQHGSVAPEGQWLTSETSDHLVMFYEADSFL